MKHDPVNTAQSKAVTQLPQSSRLRQSRLISTILSPALSVWLRSQTDRVETLHVKLEGGDRQVLSGYIPAVSISAQRAVYQGIHLSCVELKGSEIRVNMGQIVRGKPFRLLNEIPVHGEISISLSDLNASIQTPLLAQAIEEIISKLIHINLHRLVDSSFGRFMSAAQRIDLENLRVNAAPDRLTLSGWMQLSSRRLYLTLHSRLRLLDVRTLSLEDIQMSVTPTSQSDRPFTTVDDISLDLGSEVCLHELAVHPDRLFCRGTIRVIPA
ncbi:MAG: LmeA family phospholipid-binding protein [Elainellaceae cyanobacterium]